MDQHTGEQKLEQINYEWIHFHLAATEVTDLIVGHPVTDWPIDGTSLEMERANEAERVKREQKIKIDGPVSKVKIEEREHPKNEE